MPQPSIRFLSAVLSIGLLAVSSSNAWTAPPKLGSTMDRIVLESVEEAALETPGMRDLHTDQWPLTDVEFRFWARYSIGGTVLSVHRERGEWHWTMREVRDRKVGYALIDRGDGPEAERLWNDVLALGVMELPQEPQDRSTMLVDGLYRAIQVRIDGGYIAIASPHSEAEFRSDRIVDTVFQRVGQFVEANVDWPPYPDDDLEPSDGR